MKKISQKAGPNGLTRRDLLKASGVVLGGLAFGGPYACSGSGSASAQQQCGANGCNYPVDAASTQQYSYPGAAHLGLFTPNTPLAADEMRITFLGTNFPPSRLAQQMVSIFVEVGPWITDPRGGPGKAADSFVFDCGSGVVSNYKAMGISYGRMDKIFISHLHGDHMSDLTAIYCFGPSEDRMWPLYVWGHGPSLVPNPGTTGPKYYDDGTYDFCDNFRRAMRWHTESFSFLSSSYPNYPIPNRETWGTPCDLVPVGDDAPNDGYGLVPIELDWTKVGGVAYNNPSTGVKITHFPTIHCRRGAIGYKLEWNGLSMIYTSDTRPETNSIDQAKNNGKGVDVFIHEMILPPELLTMKNAFPPLTSPPPPGASAAFDAGVKQATNIEKSSHTPQGAFGYLLSQISPKPRLSVIAHFPAADDTVKCAMNSVQAHFPDAGYPVLGRDIIWATDLMVLKVKKNEITQMIAQPSRYTFGAPMNMPSPLAAPKYSSPTAQLDQSTLIDSGSGTYCDNGY